MSTLIPGSEPWSIAEPLELASDIWRALEEKYAPKEVEKNVGGSGGGSGGRSVERINGGGGGGLDEDVGSQGKQHGSEDGNADGNLNDTLAGNTQGSGSGTGAGTGTDFLSSWINGKTAAQPQPSPTATNDTTLDKPGLDPSSHQTVKPPSGPPPNLTTGNNTDINSAKIQPTTLAQLEEMIHDDPSRAKLQAAATKMLMQKLPTRDMRFLWAVLYGGDNAPWPGTGLASNLFAADSSKSEGTTVQAATG
jgi:hypothetical protein